MATAAGTSKSLTTQPSAHERLTRSTAAFVGAGGIFYGLITAPTVVSQWNMTPWWWTFSAVGAVFGSAIAVSLAAARGTMRTIRRTIDIFAVSFLAALSTWFAVVDFDVRIPSEVGVWLTLFPGLAALALAITSRPRVVAPFLVIVMILGQLQNALVQTDSSNRSILLDIAYAIAFSALFCGACFGVIGAGRTLDSTAHSARTNAAQNAATEARSAERRRFDALIHDGAMATFLTASRTENTPALAQQAAATLSQLDRLRSGESSTDAFDEHAFVAHIRASAAAVDDNANISVVHQSDSNSLAVPPTVTRAFGAGVIEAIRNVVRHAGNATYEVRIALSDAEVTIAVVDDGVGFDPTEVPPDRMGLQVSIANRFAELPGGWSRV